MGEKLSVGTGLILIIMILVSGSGVIHLTASTEQGVVLSVEPALASVSIGESFAVVINVSNVKDLNKWEMRISWDASIIELDPPNTGAVEEGSFLRGAGPTKFEVFSYSSGSGDLLKVACSMLQARGASGSGILLVLRFKAIAGGDTSINVSNSKLSDSVFRNIVHSCSSGVVSVKSVLRDIEVLPFECPSDVILGKRVQLNATIKNKGAITEASVNVNLYVNSVFVNSTTIYNLAASSEVTCSFSWKPSAVGTYEILINATPVPGETKVHDNFFIRTVNVGSRDLKISLHVPTWLIVNSSTSINVSITNLGTFKEENVKSYLIINGKSSPLQTVSSLDVDESTNLTYQWNPLTEGKYNITAYVEPQEGEFCEENNVDSKEINVVQALTGSRILIVADDDSANQIGHQRGTSLPDFKDVLDLRGYKYDVWITSTQGHPALELLTRYDLVIWTCGDFVDYSNKVPDKIDANTLELYLYQGGNILIEGQRICWNRLYTTDSFARNVLHITYQTSNEASPLKIIDSTHPITANLPTTIPWAIVPIHSGDGVAPINGGRKIIAYESFERGAVIAFDGTEEGIGSVIIYSFPLYWMPENEKRTLVLNSVDWLTRFGIGKVGGKMLNLPSESIYFIYTHPEEAGWASTYDAAAGAMIYSRCTSPQYQGFTNTRNWILPSGRVNHTEIDNSILVIVGNPKYHKVANYYENTELPAIRSTENSTHFMFLDSAGRTIAALSKNDVESGMQDLLVIQAFKDESNIILSMYGFSWRGTWATGIYLAEKMVKNLGDYEGAHCILYWQDTNSDGVPGLTEINVLAKG